MEATENFQAALRHSSKLKNLTQFELEELQDYIYTKLAEGRQFASDNWYNDPTKRTGKDIIEDIDNMLADPDFIRLLPSSYFEAEKMLKEVQKKLYLKKQAPVKRNVNKRLIYPDLWKRADNSLTVKGLLEEKKITVGGVYNPDPSRSKNCDTELLKVYYILRPLMIPHHKTPGARCFLNEFKAPIPTEKTLSTEPSHHSEEYKRLKRIFYSILPKE